MNEQKYKNITHKFIEEILGKGNTQMIEEIVDRGFVMHDPNIPQEVRGPDGVKRFVQELHAGVPDVRFKIESLLVEGDQAVCRWTSTGTHTGELFDQPASGKRITVTGMDILRFSNDKIVEDYSCWDALGFYRQIGAIPEMESTILSENR
ncbi:MAG: ester cyclase [Candidatus Zixiibacteriota bacterium]|nr:MAG: ester cyclase [candidate division Zixibacteria bacterium]